MAYLEVRNTEEIGDRNKSRNRHRERPPELERSQAGQQSRGEDEGHKADPERRGALARGTAACGRGEWPHGRSGGGGGDIADRGCGQLRNPTAQYI